MPSGTWRQTPTVPGTAHEKQVWLQAVLQQTPCAQNPLLHSSFEVHVAPKLPPQVPLRQGRPLAQSSSVAQTDLQMPRATSGKSVTYRRTTTTTTRHVVAKHTVTRRR